MRGGRKHAEQNADREQKDRDWETVVKMFPSPAT